MPLTSIKTANNQLTKASLLVLVVFLGLFVPCLILEIGLRFYEALFDSQYQSLSSLQTTPQKTNTQSLSLRDIIVPSRFAEVVYELRPGLIGRFQQQELAINSQGFRGKETVEAKPAGTLRIVGVGDSVMFGWGVTQEQSYLNLVEADLRKAGIPIEVLNFAVPGYNTAMEVGTLERRALRFQPDIVLLHVVNNDYDVPAFMLSSPSPWTFKRSFLFDFTLDRMQRFENAKAANDGFGFIPSLGSTRSHEVRAEYRGLSGPGGFEKALENLAVLAKEHNFKVLIVAGALPNAMRSQLRKVQKRLGFGWVAVRPVVDGYFKNEHPNISAAERRKMLILNEQDPHPSALGHRLYADAVLTALRSNYFLTR